MSMSVELEFNTQIDRALLLKSSKMKFGSATTLFVTPTKRLGNSGARVYRIRVKDENGLMSLHYYAKIHRSRALREEYDAYRKYVGGRIPQAPEVWMIDGEKEACLCCFEAGGNPQTQAATLVDELENRKDPINAQRICETLELLYRRFFSSWQEAAETDDQFQWFKEYRKYLRWNRTEEFLQKWIGNKKSEPFKIDGNDYQSPYSVIEKSLKEFSYVSTAKKRPVHGDLHQRNIILDRIGDTYNPWIIDFGWTKKFHALVDYALLEASLKIFHFYKCFSEQEYMRIHDMMDCGFSKEYKSNLDPWQQDLWSIIGTIRKHAKEETPETWPNEYYVSSLLVSIGMIAIPTCPPRAAWLTAAWFATKIRNQLFG